MTKLVVLWSISTFSVILMACSFSGLLLGQGGMMPTPDVYMTAAAGAQTRNAIASETSVAEFLSPTAPAAATSVPSQAIAPTITSAPAFLPTGLPLAASPTAVPPPTAAATLALPSNTLAGTFSIVNLHTQKCLTAPSNLSGAAASVLQAACNGAAYQLWDLVAAGNGYYQVVSRNSDKCLDVEDKHAAQNYDLVQWQCDNTTSQRWRFDQAGLYNDLAARSKATAHAAPSIYMGAYYQLVAQHSNMCADLNAWSHDDGTHVIQFSCARSDNDNQLWGLK